MRQSILDPLDAYRVHSSTELQQHLNDPQIIIAKWRTNADGLTLHYPDCPNVAKMSEFVNYRTFAVTIQDFPTFKRIADNNGIALFTKCERTQGTQKCADELYKRGIIV